MSSATAPVYMGLRPTSRRTRAEVNRICAEIHGLLESTADMIRSVRKSAAINTGKLPTVRLDGRCCPECRSGRVSVQIIRSVTTVSEK